MLSQQDHYSRIRIIVQLYIHRTVYLFLFIDNFGVFILAILEPRFLPKVVFMYIDQSLRN